MLMQIVEESIEKQSIKTKREAPFQIFVAKFWSLSADVELNAKSRVWIQLHYHFTPLFANVWSEFSQKICSFVQLH